MGIGKTLRRDLSKLFMRVAGYQGNMACENFQVCEGLFASIEGVTHDVGERRREKI